MKKRVAKKTVPKKAFDRGRVEKIELKKPFTFNGNRVSEAIIEIDHINYGLDKKTYKLNLKKRSDFTIGDVEKFLGLLDDEYISPKSYKGRNTRYEMRIDCPIQSKYYGKEFILIVETNYDSPNLIHTITLFPNW